MYDAILVPTDGSDPATAALDHAISLAARHDATLHVVFVADTTVDSVTNVQGRVLDTLESEGEEVVDDAATRAAASGVDVVTEVLQGEPHATIVDYADVVPVDLVVMATHGRRGLERALLGSLTERVVRTADPPVLTVGPDAPEPPERVERVLVATDGSDQAMAAVDEAIELCAAEGAHLHVLTAISPTRLGFDVRSEVGADLLDEHAQTIVDRATVRAEKAGVEASGNVRVARASAAIEREVEAVDPDVLVLGTRGRGGVERFLLGSVAETAIRTADVPVLTVRKAAAEEDEGAEDDQNDEAE
jgi:nucleotide-binding universal stress UspA family protein